MGDLKEDYKVLNEYLKAKHDARVNETPNRIKFAIKKFEENGIKYELKNETNAHFHCWRKSDGKLFQYYAGTGKIQGYTNKRGIHSLIALLRR